MSYLSAIRGVPPDLSPAAVARHTAAAARSTAAHEFSDKLAEYKRAALVARERGDHQAARLLSNHYPRDGTPALTPKEVQNLITREIPKEPPPSKNNKDLTPLEIRELELRGLFGGRTRKHRSRRFKNKKSKKHMRRRTTRKH